MRICHANGAPMPSRLSRFTFYLYCIQHHQFIHPIQTYDLWTNNTDGCVDTYCSSSLSFRLTLLARNRELHRPFLYSTHWKEKIESVLDMGQKLCDNILLMGCSVLSWHEQGQSKNAVLMLKIRPIIKPENLQFPLSFLSLTLRSKSGMVHNFRRNHRRMWGGRGK